MGAFCLPSPDRGRTEVYIIGIYYAISAFHLTTAARHATAATIGINREISLARQESSNLNVTQCIEGIQTAALWRGVKPLPTWRIDDNFQGFNL
jgi:hypothetical protein